MSTPLWASKVLKDWQRRQESKKLQVANHPIHLLTSGICSARHDVLNKFVFMSKLKNKGSIQNKSFFQQCFFHSTPFTDTLLNSFVTDICIVLQQKPVIMEQSEVGHVESIFMTLDM